MLDQKVTVEQYQLQLHEVLLKKNKGAEVPAFSFAVVPETITRDEE